MILHPELIVDAEGNRKAVILPWDEWQEILEALEAVEDVKAYDGANARPSDPVPFRPFPT